MMKKSWTGLLTGLGVLIWLMLIVSLFYISHKPFSPEAAGRLLLTIKDILVSTLIIAIAGGLGRFFFRNLKVNPLTAMALQSGTGLGFMSILAIILGSTIGFNRFFVMTVLLFAGAFLWRHVLAWGWQLTFLSEVASNSSRLQKLLGGVVALLFLMTLSVALSPPIKFDSLVYHLSLPAYYLEAGKFVYHPQLLFWGMPQLAEILYTLAMAIGSSEAAAILAWTVGLVTVLGILGYTNERLGSSAAWISVLTVMSSYTIVMLLPTAYVEWFSILYGLGLMVLLDAWSHENQNKLLIWSGIFIGFSLGIKYTNGVLLIAGIIVVLIRSIKSGRNFSGFVKDLLLLCVPALLVASPWLIKNLLATGNPFYPFIFPSGAVDSYRLNFYQSPGESSWQDTLLLPLYATIHGIQGGPGYSATIGPLFLALCPLAFIGYRSRPEAQRITLQIASVISIAGIGVWMIAGCYSELLIQSRLYFSLIPSLACLAGAGFTAITQIKSFNIRFARIMGVLITLVFLLSAYEITRDILRKDSIKVVLGIETTGNYLGNNLGWYYPAMEAINGLPDGAKVLMLWEPRAYYCLPKCIPDEVLDRWSHELSLRHDAKTIINYWKNIGVSHILFYKLGAEFIKDEDHRTTSARYTHKDWAELDRFLNLLGKPVDIGPDYQLYPLIP